jgi:large subunit ribosomal protein L25
MADRIKLELEDRTLTGKKVNRLRREGLLPATVYGKGVGPFTVQLNLRTFTDAYRHAGRTGLVDLAIPGQSSIAAFVHSLQRHPVTRTVQHVDFLAVDLRVEVTVDVPVHLTGEPDLVRRGDAILNQILNSVAVHALPADIPPFVEVDISGLDSFDKSIRVSDITLATKGSIVTSPDELVVTLSPARVEEEVAEEAPEAAAEPELVREEREEESEEE